jgi:Icc-related predicted phosphoesterase
MLGGELMMKPCGSPAVRAAIEKYQPLLGLHGHVHESHGYTKIGRTLCLNPGSEYTQETLRGYIVDLEPEKINLYQPVQG